MLYSCSECLHDVPLTGLYSADELIISGARGPEFVEMPTSTNDHDRKTFAMTSSDSSRRDFLKTSAYSAGVLGAASRVAAGTAAASSSANAKIRIGFVGPGGRGFGAHVKRLTKLQLEGQPIELVAVCDVYSEHRDRAASYIEKETGKG
ncbi:MAG: hypothetical protein GY826_09570, partial [Fuerstiella sp.]|nr:hypothetical protein [Fuerstiella sp.]